MATGINYCQNGRLAKAKVTHVFWIQALSHSLQGFFLKNRTLKQFDAYGCYGAIFASREFKLTKRSSPQHVYIARSEERSLGEANTSSSPASDAAWYLFD